FEFKTLAVSLYDTIIVIHNCYVLCSLFLGRLKWADDAMTVDGMSYIVGLDIEFNIGRKNNWALVSQAHFFSKDKSWDVSNRYWEREGRLNYHSIRIPVGIRFKPKITDKIGLYVDANYSIDFALDSYVAMYTVLPQSIKEDKSKIKPTAFPFLGCGVSYKRVKLGLLFEPTRDILQMSETGSEDTDYNALSISISYKI
ncbi:hypothetical protein, partial [Carboxylicivirga caseinilyticus]|uniref:hypothetical protein n=1 Tax=Carboxylicivirga caseinilyticus TaxID=3417572 RepID=UPI003D357BE7|nr:hypothetical protein [Marinilabiliaceae bacterium A049]